MMRGERSDEAWAWYSAVYEAIQEIPYGKVTSYGHIARLLGKPQCPRQVGVCLKHLPSPSTDPSKKSPTWHSDNVPWQRVINAKGGISPRGPSGASRQAAVLRAEGVEVTQGALGEFTVDFGRYGWFPSVLPSEAGLVESSDEEDEEAAAYHT
ncbi:DNA binding methylated-DNA--cysteine S-methyltransferase [Trematosphaeria pertusa]|uniref:DNA binding methylated-DNA--cysteine S-methyltransferase n=1 Tax=Trematosphaeria pertusa TaxID=390896 RepID=A0A6A6I2K8_9PLEO|nr:DNA binding methylated-DNA--cysteine S-methyltransferase [Trematosphaeria pertusa]KAF2244103.1 DNA binding methylated-DNA--cysteine S-methyltransferase [Trematosphaeria pertusa]